jgi:predicted ester cyclase
MKPLKKGGFILSVSLLILISISSCKLEDSESELKPLIKKYLEAWNSGNYGYLKEILMPNFEFRINPNFKPVMSIDSLIKEIEHMRIAYPDFHIEIKEEIYTKDKIAARWVITATNLGPGSFPPTGKKINSPGMSILHVQHGKLIDEWVIGDNLLWMQQLGYKLTPPHLYEH